MKKVCMVFGSILFFGAILLAFAPKPDNINNGVKTIGYWIGAVAIGAIGLLLIGKSDKMK